MSEKKKRWVVIHFPNGEFTGKMTIGIDGKYVMNAEMAKQIIDKTEKEYENNKSSSDGRADSEGTPEVQSVR